VDIDIADQRDFHRRGFAFDLLIDGSDVRWRRQLGVRQIEGERGVEKQRELLIVQHGGDTDAVGRFEYEADEGRLHRCADANGDASSPGHRALLAQRALPRPARSEFADHLGRKAGRLALPIVGQHIDEHPFAGRHGVDGHLARQRQPGSPSHRDRAAPR
jgi:hypothetical protein